MKKILTMLLAIITVASLVACSTDDDSNIKFPSNDIVDVDSLQQFDFWELKDNVKVETVKPLKWELQTYGEDEVYVTTTMLSFDRDAVLEKVKNNAYFRDMFDDIYPFEHEIHYTIKNPDNGEDYYRNYLYRAIGGEKTASGESLYITSSTMMNYYATPNGVELIIQGIKDDNFNQDAIYEIAKDVFGNYAEYIVYGKDKDGCNDDGDVLKNGTMLVQVFGDDSTTYRFYREVWHDNGMIDVHLSIEVQLNEKEDIFSHLFEDEAVLYEQGDYTFDKVMVDEYSDFTPLNSQKFGSDMFEELLPSYKKFKTEEWSYTNAVHEDGTREHYSDVKCFVMNSEGLVVGSYGNTINVREKDGEVSLMDFSADIRTYHEIDTYAQEYSETCAGLFEKIFKNLEIGEVTYDAERKETEKEIEGFEINGKEYDGRFVVNHSSGWSYIRFAR